jgi:glyoxalase-like protein
MTGPTGDGPVPLWLDHASVEVPELGTAIGHLERRLGLHATVSPQAADRHGRIYLDRTYLEVAAGTAPATGWRVHLWFLRFDDLEALRAHLEDAGIEHRIGEYEGVDGTWDDVQIRAGPVPLPILVRRTSPPEVAGDWPPTLARPHRCGARTLEAVHVTVGSLEAAVEAYRALLGPGHAVVTESRGPARADARLASGRIVLEEGDPRDAPRHRARRLDARAPPGGRRRSPGPGQRGGRLARPRPRFRPAARLRGDARPSGADRADARRRRREDARSSPGGLDATEGADAATWTRGPALR